MFVISTIVIIYFTLNYSNCTRSIIKLNCNSIKVRKIKIFFGNIKKTKENINFAIESLLSISRLLKLATKDTPCLPPNVAVLLLDSAWSIIQVTSSCCCFRQMEAKKTSCLAVWIQLTAPRNKMFSLRHGGVDDHGTGRW